jgi:putative tricarboxylic transport membrane protein
MGLVLGHLVENSLAQSMILFDQDLSQFFSRPIALTFFALAILSIASTPLGRLIKTRKRTEADKLAHGNE